MLRSRVRPWRRPGKGRLGARPNWRAVGASDEKSRKCILENVHKALLNIGDKVGLGSGVHTFM